jgi:hypothetical protein
MLIFLGENRRDYMPVFDGELSQSSHNFEDDVSHNFPTYPSPCSRGRLFPRTRQAYPQGRHQVQDQLARRSAEGSEAKQVDLRFEERVSRHIGDRVCESTWLTG